MKALMVSQATGRHHAVHPLPCRVNELFAILGDRLISGTPHDVSLCDTQLAFLNSEEYSHPYY